MTLFQVHRCTRKDCGLRIPINPEKHRGTYCPRCGAPMTGLGEPYAQPTSNDECHHMAASHSFSVILDNFRSAYNVGAIFRTADGAGLSHLYLCGITPTPDANSPVRKTALGAEDSLSWSWHANSLSLAADLRREGCRLLALECVPGAQSLLGFRLSITENRRDVLVVGGERTGIDPGLLELCDAVLSLPMQGRKGSLNVAVAFGIAAYWLSFGSSSHPPGA